MAEQVRHGGPLGGGLSGHMGLLASLYQKGQHEKG